ncbi:phosphotransferase [Streptomyces sp. NPDC051940]|uniref:phosphotransferase family protein n=1 Tax=Streptomyces sp. NPDC051940 TaxID=3155675 RepID=UPI0034417F35
MPRTLIDRLAALRPGHPPDVLADRPDGTVIRSGGVVVKAHAQDTDHDALRARLRIAAHPALKGILLTPLPGPRAPLDGRPVTEWPEGAPVSPERPEDAPWAEAGRLLARLHRISPDTLPGPIPAMRGPAKAARAIRRLQSHPTTRTRAQGHAEDQAQAHAEDQDRATVLRAWRSLPAWARDEAPYDGPTGLCHGDLHFGQFVRHPCPDGPWVLIDIDDLGLGDPAWDLARPAAWYAIGLIPATDWQTFLDAYRSAGGPAAGTPRDGLWPARVETPARALTVQLAALALARAREESRPPDDVDRDLVKACGRMVYVPPGPARGD